MRGAIALPPDRFARAAGLLAAAALLASCSDLPTKPVPLVTAVGAVLDREGAPLGATRVVFIPVGLGPYDPIPPAPQSGMAFTDAQGAFSLSLYAGAYDVLVHPINSGEYGDAVVFGARISPERPRFDYRYAGVRLEGTILGPGGVPLTGARLGGYRIDHSFEHREVESSNGRYSMVLLPGTWDMYAVPPYSAQGLPTLELGPVHVAADTAIDVSLAGEPVTVTVMGPGGQPVPDAIVYLSGFPARCSGTTTSDGTSLLYVPAGNYHGYLRPPSSQDYMATRAFPVSVTGPTALALDFSGVNWTGTVFYAGSGRAADGAPVFASSISSYSSYAFATTGAAGTFQLVLMPGIVYALQIGSLEVGWFGAVGDTAFTFAVDSTAVWPSGNGSPALVRLPTPPRRPR